MVVDEDVRGARERYLLMPEKVEERLLLIF